jgi:hypothetical protein
MSGDGGEVVPIALWIRNYKVEGERGLEDFICRTAQLRMLSSPAERQDGSIPLT